MSLNVLRFGKKKVEEDKTACPNDIDKSTFFSPLIPVEVKRMVPVMHAADPDTALKVVRDAHQLIMNGEHSNSEGDSSLADSAVLAYARSAGLSSDVLATLLSGLRAILRFVLKNKIFLDVVSADLKKMNIPEKLVEAFVAVLRQERRGLEEKLSCDRLGFPKLDKLRWRVDIVISTGAVSRVMRPTVTLQVRPSTETVD